MSKKQVIKAYLSKIGRLGGLKSRRKLDPSVARRMVLLREARKAFRQHYARCFWSFDPNYHIEFEDIHWVGEQLMKHGDRRLWILGVKLCR